MLYFMSTLSREYSIATTSSSRTSMRGGRRAHARARRRDDDEPLVSLITVVYNAESTIEDTIRSVIEQTYKSIEHIVIDGGSTDGTIDIFHRYEDELDYWISERDAGIYDAMNKGFEIADGDIIGFLNADDVFSDDRALSRVVSAFQDPEVDVCFGDLIYVTQDNKTVVRYWKSRPFVSGSFGYGWAPAHPTFYIRRSALMRFGMFDLSYQLAADAEFMMRYLEKGGAHSKYISEVQVRMRVGGATNRTLSNVFRQNREIFRALRENGIPYSALSFCIHKLKSRIWQRLAAIWMKEST